jgi:hypothetical protein
MTKQELDYLIQTAEKYLGVEMEISISRKINKPNLKPFKFIQIERTIGFSEDNEEMKFIIPNGILKSSEGVTIKKPLTEIVKYFENKTT